MPRLVSTISAQYVNGDMIRRITENIDCMKAAE